MSKQLRESAFSSILYVGIQNVLPYILKMLPSCSQGFNNLTFFKWHKKTFPRRLFVLKIPLLSLWQLFCYCFSYKFDLKINVESTYKWYHAVFIFHCLSYLTRVMLSRSMLFQIVGFPSFSWLNSTHNIYTLYLYSFVGGYLGNIHILAIVNNAAMTTGVNIFPR